MENQSEYKINCPTCQKEIIYQRYFNFQKASLENKECRNCTRNSLRNCRITSPYQRTCPTCDKIIIYKKEFGFKQAITSKTVCEGCKQKIRNLKNPETYKIKQKRWRQNGKLQQRNYYLKRTFGITLEDYNNLFLKQEGKCKICQRHQSELDKALAVDHNHQNGQVRGLLCNPCNRALGLLNENIISVQNMIIYIKEYN